MTAKIGNLGVDLSLEDANWTRDLEKARRDVRSFSGRVNTALGGMNRQVKTVNRSLRALQRQMLLLAGATGVGLLVKNVGASATRTAASFEQMEVKLEKLTKGRGRQTLQDLNQWALRMPVNTQKAVDGFVLMQAMGLNPTIERLQVLTDVASIFGDDVLQRLALQLGQASAKGRLMAQDLNIMAEAGINARQYLSDVFGMTLADLQQSAIPVADQIQAIFDGMARDFGGSAQDMMTSWNGITATTQSIIMEIERRVMAGGVFDMMKNGLHSVNVETLAWIENNNKLFDQDLPEVLGTIATIMGDIGRLVGVVVTNAQKMPKEFWAALPYLRGVKAYQMARDAIVGPEATRQPWETEYGPGLWESKARAEFWEKQAGKTKSTTAPAPPTDDYLSADYLKQTEYLRRGPLFDLEEMAEQARAGGVVIDEEIDKLIKKQVDWEKKNEQAAKNIQRHVNAAVFSMKGAFVDFFDFTSEGFLDLEKLIKNIGSSLVRRGLDQLIGMALGAIAGGIGGGIGGTGSGGGTVGQQSMLSDLSFSGGGYIGETVRGVGLASGRSYEFHADEIVTPAGGGTGGTTINIANLSTLDARSFRQAFGNQVVDIHAQALDDNNQRLWASLGRRG